MRCFVGIELMKLLVNMQTTTIEVITEDHKIVQVKSVMPVWVTKTQSDQLRIRMVLLGMETIVDREEEVEEAVKELFAIFCKFSESHGLGIESELQAMSWKSSGADGKEFNVDTNVPFLDSLIDTGESSLLTADL